MVRFSVFSIVLGFFLPSGAFADASSQGFYYQTRLYNAAGTAPLTSTVNITYSIYDPSGTCLLYQEQRANVDLSSIQGILSHSIGLNTGVGYPGNDPGRSANDPGLTMAIVFANAATQIRAAGANCASGYTPSAGDARVLAVTIDDSGTITTYNRQIGSVPTALVCQSVQGFAPSDFIKVSGNVTQANMLSLFSNTVDASTNSWHHHDSRYAQLGGSIGSNSYSSGNFGIGDTTPSTDLSFGGNIDRTIAIERHSTSGSVGSALNIAAGGAGSTGTDKAGGNLTLSSGTSTGTGSSSIEFKTASPQGSTNTTDNGPTTKMTILGSGYVGIGTVTPNKMLDVYGTANIGSASGHYLQLGNNFYASNSVTEIGPALYLHNSTATKYGIKLQKTGTKYGTTIFGPNQANRFISFNKISSAGEPAGDDDFGTEYMRIDLDNGRVGIGTVTPSAGLHVVGGITSPGVGANSEAFGLGAAAPDANGTAVGAGAATTSNGGTAIGRSATAGYESVAIGYSANSGSHGLAVGWGVTAGGSGVAIGKQTSAAGAGATRVGSFGSAGYSGSISLGSGAATTAANQFIAGSNSYAIDDVYFGKGASNATPTSYKIRGTSATAASGANGASILLLGGAGDGAGTNGNVILAHDGSSSLGNVGINNTAPSQVLDVMGKTSTNFVGIMYTDPDTSRSIILGEGYNNSMGLFGTNNTTSVTISPANDNSGNGGQVKIGTSGKYGINIDAGGYNAGGDIVMSTWNGVATGPSVSRLTIKQTSGNVGIGIAGPQTTLQVAGVISPSVTNTYALGSATYMFTDVYATSGSVNTSDRRAKKEISESELGLDFVLGLNPVQYRWMSHPDKRLFYGFIAQDLETYLGKKEFSGLVYDKEADKYGIRYTEFIAPIVKAIQEMYDKFLSNEAKVIELDAKVEELARANQNLQQRLEALERKITQ